MSDDYRELRQALAAQPTTEPWYHCQPYQTIGPLQTIHGPVKKMRTDFVSAQQAPVHRKIIVPMPCGDCGLGVSSSVMGYIAAANPETVSRLLGEIDRLRAENERLKTLEAAVQDLLFDADECDCNGLGLHALHNAWSPVHKALDAIDAAMKREGER